MSTATEMSLRYIRKIVVEYINLKFRRDTKKFALPLFRKAVFVRNVNFIWNEFIRNAEILSKFNMFCIVYAGKCRNIVFISEASFEEVWFSI